MNDESILVSFNFYEKSVEDRFHLYDLDLVYKESFGQHTDQNKPFYFFECQFRLDVFYVDNGPE